jgi:hypothetical protein
MNHRFASFVVVFSVLLASCGGTSSGPGAVKSPFLPEDEALFDGGVEFVDDPDKLSGRWRKDWEREVSDRVARADAVFVGEVIATRLGSDFEGRSFLDVTVSIEKPLLGTNTETVELRSRSQEPGFRTLARAGDRLLGGKFVAFVKWAEVDGAVRGRFHLAHASEFVLSAVRFQLAKR